MRLLPMNLAPAAIGAAHRGADRIVIGQREEDLAAVELDFADHPRAVSPHARRVPRTR